MVKELLFVFGLATHSAMAAEWTGYIVDKSCAGNREMWGGNENCAKMCMRNGSPAVFVTEDGKIYQVANQDKVKEYAGGHKVTITGKMAGDTITVETVK